MALFPDRIVQKNSVDPRATIVEALQPGGSDPIVAGELVIQRSAGSAALITLDSQGKPVTVGAVTDDAPVAPSITLNFEGDGTDTNFAYTSGAFDAANKKFGTFSLKSQATSEPSDPRKNSLVIFNADDVTLSTGAWTFEFWIYGDPTEWNYVGGVGNKYALIANKKNYVWGPGALNIFLDGGTSDRGGVGTTTSYTEDQALGSVVFSLTIPGFDHDNPDPLIPSTGEIVTSRSVSVLDNTWHHVAISHEGGGIYSMFVDGQLTQRNILSGAIDHNNPGNSGINQPSGWDFCGTLVVNDEYPDTGVASGLELPSGRFSLDSVGLYQGLAKYKGLYAFDVPTGPVDPALAVRQPLNTIESLIDTNIPANPTDNSLLVFDAASGTWVAESAPPYDISGNSLGDIGDVDLVDQAQLSNEDFLRWNTATQNWVNSGLNIDLLGDVSVTNPANAEYLYFNGATGQWENKAINYSEIVGRPTALSDLTMDLPSSTFNLNGLGDVTVSSLANGNVLVWNDAEQRWKNESAPAPDLSIALLQDIGDVIGVEDVGLQNTRSDFVGLRWNYTQQRWEPSEIDYDEINGQPDRLSDFINDLSVSNFPNNVGYLNATSVKNSIGPEDLDNTNINSPQEGQTLIYRSGNWKNELGPPANIAFSSIGELQDVTYFRPTSGVEGELTIEGMGLLNWDSPYQPTNIRFNLNYRQADQAIGMEAIRTSDETGSSIHVSRGGGVDIRSDVNFIRLRGKPDTTTNRPVVYFETGDAFAAADTGNFIAFQMPEEIDEDALYRLPAADGDSGDVLATDGNGRLSWISRVANNSLGQLDDVDLATELPIEGSALVYNEAAQLWVPGDPVVEIDLNETSINELQDVDTSTTTPSPGQGLVWDGSAWVPGDVSDVDLGTSSIDDLQDVDTSSVPPLDKQGLGWDAASGSWKPMDVAADVSELRTRDLADVSNALPVAGDILVYAGGDGTDLSGTILGMPLDGTAESLGQVDNFIFTGTNPPTHDELDAPAGASGGSLLFTPGNGRLEAPDNAAFALDSDSFTAEVWFKGESAATVTNDTVLFFGQRAASNNDQSCFFQINNRAIKFQFGSQSSGGSSNQVIESPELSQIQNNTWHHVAVIREGIEFRMYLDGSLVHTQTNSEGVHNSGSAFLVGTVNNPAYSKGHTFNLKNLLLTKEVLYSGSTFTPPLELAGAGAKYVPQALSEVLDGVQVDLSTESIDALADVDTTTAAPTSGQALVWDGSTWIPGDVQVDEASPAVIWNISASGLDHFVFEGPGFPEPANDPTLYVTRGQKYTFNKTISQHPFQVQETQGTGQSPYTRGFNKTQPIGLDTLEWVVPMDAPSILYYQCTLHAGMNGVIYVLDEGSDSVDLSAESIDALADVDTTTAAPATGQALIWDGANWIPGNVLASGVAGSAISQRATEAQTSDASGLATYVDLGTSGTMVSIIATGASWVTLYATEAARTADAARDFGKDPLQGSGVLAEFFLEASTEVLTSPSTNYFNANPVPAEEIYALVRDSSGTVLAGVEVTITAYAISGYTAVSGGTFGSG